jgi:mannan endo-1,4-beta-mannosidase
MPQLKILNNVRQVNNQPMWAWFMIWYKFVDKANTPEQIKDLYNYPKTLSHGEVEIN